MGNTVEKPQQNPHQDQAQQNQQEEENQDETFTCDCIIKYIQVKLDENVSDIKCPAMTCQHSLEPLSCRPKITPQAFEKWCDVLCESSVLRVEDKVYCPNVECRELILNECGDTNLRRCVCAYCKKPYCLLYKAPWHDDNSTCVEDENDIAFEHLSKEEKWQRCPVCKHCIQHIGGCKLVECECGNKFCYLCGKQKCMCELLVYNRLVLVFVILAISLFSIGVPLFLITLIALGVVV